MIAQNNCYFVVDGLVYDLSSFMNPTSDWVWQQQQNNGEIYQFSYNLCTPLHDTTCYGDNGGVFSACQRWPNPNFQYSVGLGKFSAESYGPSNSSKYGVTVLYTQGAPVGNSPRSFEMDFICDSQADVSYYVAHLEFLICSPFPLCWIKWCSLHFPMEISKRLSFGN